MGGKIIVVALQLPQPVAAEKQSIFLSTFFIQLNLLVLSRMATMACQRFFPMTVSISPWPIRLLSSTKSGCSSMLVAP